jgi:hypothetical protein
MDKDAFHGVDTFMFHEGYNNKTGREIFCPGDIFRLEGKDILPIRSFKDMVGAVVVSAAPTCDPVFISGYDAMTIRWNIEL